MFKKDKVSSFILGFISYFVITTILNLLGIDTFIARTIIVAIIALIGFLITQLNKKNSSS